MTLVGSKIGSIRITDVLGVGGMGEVYAGFDEKLRREVAVKALRGDRLDEATRARLLREARALSRLSHPHICVVYDFLEQEEGGLLVLERIQGENLREALMDGIAPAAKLRIAGQIAEALAAAHAKGIVHRDLKLANVMLDGQVKVLDFGLARASGERSLAGEEGREALREDEGWTALLKTKAGHVVGTAACMSPEQARGEPVTTAGDVYSFGLLLQELFTGAPPYPQDLPLHLLIIKAQEGETLPAAGIDGDLASLIQRMKALAPAERPTAVEVLHRLAWIRDRPKRRLRAAAIACAVLVLAGGAVKYTLDLRWERDRAVAARAEAERIRTESEEVARFLEEVFEVSDPSFGRGGDVPARELLDEGASRISTELRGQPLVRARLMGTIGRIYVRLGLYEEAGPLLEEALAVRDRELGPEHLDVAESLNNLGLLRLEQSRKEAEPLFRRALAIREKVLGPEDPEVAEVLGSLGSLLGRLLGDWKGAEVVLRRAQVLREKDPSSAELAMILGELAVARALQKDNVEAERLFRRTLEIREQVLPPGHPDIAKSLVALGALLGNTGRGAEAVSLYQRGELLLERRLGPDHPLVALTWNNLGNSYADLGRLDESEAALLRSLAIREKVFGAGHVDLIPSLWGLGHLYRLQGRPADVEAVAARGLAIGEKALPENNGYLRDLRAWRAELGAQVASTVR
jgi:serine/threonine-protein kinase